MSGEVQMAEQRMCRIDGLTIALVGSEVESEALDALLWEVLWQPLGLPRDIRRSFALEGDCIELAASKADGSLLGGLVANWTAASNVEIRHIAVAPCFQGLGIGSMLAGYLIEMLKEENCLRLQVIARNTSVPFFRRLGFDEVDSSIPDHPYFQIFGISFTLLEKEIGDRSQARIVAHSPKTNLLAAGNGHPKFFGLRKYRPSDLKPLRQLIHETIDACYSGVYPLRAVLFFKEYHSEEEIARRETSGAILVAEHDGTLVATGALVGREITGVFVSPSIQGRGIGRAIMWELEDLAKAQGCGDVELSVSLPSRGFYESLGYEILGDSAIDVGQGEQLDFWTAKKAL
jgi:ribosomal protein S18 acetylase RimI-like enzyme